MSNNTTGESGVTAYEPEQQTKPHAEGEPLSIDTLDALTEHLRLCKNTGVGSCTEYQAEVDGPQTTVGEVSIVHYTAEQNPYEDEEVFKIYGTPTFGSEFIFSIRRPAAEWTIEQEVVDGNLQTRIVLDDQAILSLPGPPAEEVDGNIEIIVPGISAEDVLVVDPSEQEA